MIRCNKSLLGVAACLWWLASASCCPKLRGAEVLPGVQVAAYQAVHVVPGERERVFVVPVGDPQPRTFEVVAAASGHQLLFGEPGQYLVLWFKEGAADQGQVSVTIRQPGPVPPPTPVPPGPTPPTPVPPDEISARLLPLIQAANDKPTAAKLAANYRTVLANVDSGAIKSVLVARTKLANLNGTMTINIAWKPAIDGMVKELDGVLDLPTMAKVFRGTIAALEAAAR